MRRILGFKKRRERDRLLRQISSLEAHLKHFSEEQKNYLWHREAMEQLGAAQRFLENYDADGGWICLQSAQRCLIKGMELEEISSAAVALREESQKLSAWRRDAIKLLLKEPPTVTSVRLTEAFRIRDEYSVNQYHKIRIGSDQLIVLFAISLSTLVIELTALTHISDTSNRWGICLLIAVAAFGVLGSAFSVAQSIMTMANSSKILEYVANYWATAMRTLFGSITGLAGYVIFSSKLITINLPSDVDKIAVDLTVAFIFGYTGEKLINKIASSLGSTDTGRANAS